MVKEGLSIPLLLPCLLTHEVTPTPMGHTKGQAQVGDGKRTCSLALPSITSRFCSRFGSVDELGAGGADGFFTSTGHWFEKVTGCLSPVSFGPAGGTPRARCLSHYMAEDMTEGQSLFSGSVLFTCFEIPCVTGFVTRCVPQVMRVQTEMELRMFQQNEFMYYKMREAALKNQKIQVLPEPSNETSPSLFHKKE